MEEQSRDVGTAAGKEVAAAVSEHLVDDGVSDLSASSNSPTFKGNFFQRKLGSSSQVHPRRLQPSKVVQTVLCAENLKSVVLRLVGNASVLAP